MRRYTNYEPFTIEWWLFWKDYARDMWLEVDDVTDQCAMNDRGGHSKEMCDKWWAQWHKFTQLEESIRKHIINEYGKQ